MVDSGVQLKVRTDGKTVIASGIVHLSTPEVTIEIDNLKVQFTFVVDNDGPRYSGYPEPAEKRINIQLHNFSSSLGEGFLKAVEIGSLKGKKLFVTCFVVTTEVDIHARQLNYTFMLGDS